MTHRSKKKPLNIQQRVDHFINHSTDSRATILELVGAVLVIAICTIFVLQAYPIDPHFHRILGEIELWITIIFLFEYLVRWWAKEFSLRYLVTPGALVDLVAILPLFLPGHWQFIRLLRILRILRILSLIKDNKLLDESYMRVIQIFFTMVTILFIAAGFIYEIEHPIEPGMINTFFDALYFTIVTLTTVGYGDIVPQSQMGRAVVVAMIFSGAIIIPFQMTSLARHLVNISQRKRQVTCEECGLNFHDPDAVYCKMCGHKVFQEYSG